MLIFASNFLCMNYDVVVAGAGAAGLLAAGSAASAGAKVLLIEKMEAAGKKILITGNGRCNITNAVPMHEFYKQVFPNPRFLRPAFSEFSNKHVVELLNKLGVKTKTEDHNRVLPVSNKASDVRDALLEWVSGLGVEIKYNCKLVQINAPAKIVEEIETEYNGKYKKIKCKTLILCLGGNSYPATGSSGDGYHLAKMAGHSIKRIRPALVPLLTNNATQAGLQGLSLNDVNVSVWTQGRKIDEQRGEMLFTHFGISGPAVLLVSKSVVECLEEEKEVEIGIDLEPEMEEKELDLEMLQHLGEHGKMKLENLLYRWLQPRLIQFFLSGFNLDGNKEGHQVNSSERKKIVKAIKNLRFKITGTRSFKEAVITSGGVKLEEIDSKTMQSKIVKGLFFAGEILDLDANTGGYNLQIAWSTGHLAGKSWNLE